MWANWVKATVLKKRSLWQLPTPSDCSWIWRQILKLRSSVLMHIQYKVGRGDQISLWYDPWLHNSPILPNPTLLANSGLLPTARVKDILQNSAWNLPSSNHHEVIIFRRQIESIPIPPNSPDCICWNSLNIEQIKARHIWESIRHRNSTTAWHKILWHKLHVPRFSFILWLGFLRRLPTNDITRHYASGRDIMCPLCSRHLESFDHLFFLCDYSAAILKATLIIGDWDNFPMDWHGITDHILTFRGSKLTKQILSLSLAASFYKIWEARNKKVHLDTLIPPSVLAKDVVNIVKSRLSNSNSFLKATNYSTYFCQWLM